MRIWIFDFSDWLTWASIAIGLGVALVVMWLSGIFRFSRRHRIGDEEEMSWQQLLEMFQGKSMHKSDQAAQALEALPADELLRKLLQQLPATRSIASMSMEEREEYIRNRRSGRRSRWNPVEASLTTGIDAPPQQGLILRQADDGLAILTVNDHDDGLAILTVNDHDPGSILFVAAVEAPKSVPAVGVTVVQSRRAGKLWIVTCQFVQAIPWNVKVWFG